MSTAAIDNAYAHFRAVTLYVLLYDAPPLDEREPQAREKLSKFLISAVRKAARARRDTGRAAA